MKSYLKRIGLSVDQLVNTITGGSEDETISSRVGRNAIAGKLWALVLERLIDAIVGNGHCRDAVGE